MATEQEFQKALRFTLEAECGKNKDGGLKDGYVNDPADPGGETKYGIAKAAHPYLDIKNLTLAQAIEIYRREYWGPYGCPDMEWPLAGVVFDTFVNFSPTTAKRLITRATSWQEVVSNRKAFRGERVKQTPSQQRFLNGWLARDNELWKWATIEQQDKGTM